MREAGDCLFFFFGIDGSNGGFQERHLAFRGKDRNRIVFDVGNLAANTADRHDFIADLAVAVRAEELKAGAPVRGERVAKYNRLVEITSEMG